MTSDNTSSRPRINGVALLWIAVIGAGCASATHDFDASTPCVVPDGTLCPRGQTCPWGPCVHACYCNLVGELQCDLVGWGPAPLPVDAGYGCQAIAPAPDAATFVGCAPNGGSFPSCVGTPRIRLGDASFERDDAAYAFGCVITYPVTNYVSCGPYYCECGGDGYGNSVWSCPM